MKKPTVNLKPYRQALEALISHQTEGAMSGLLGSAAANLDDPWLREELKKLINLIRSSAYVEKGPKRLIEMFEYVYRERYGEKLDELIAYIEAVIDAQDLAWEAIAKSYGWTPPPEE